MPEEELNIPKFSSSTEAFKKLETHPFSMISLSLYTEHLTDAEKLMLASYQDYLQKNAETPYLKFFSKRKIGSWNCICRTSNPVLSQEKGKNFIVDPTKPMAFAGESLQELLDMLEGKLFSNRWQFWKQKKFEDFFFIAPSRHRAKRE